MAEITSKSDEAWATTEDVRDAFSITAQGTEPEYEDEIQDATDTIQAKWKAATGMTSLPDYATLHDLLVQATAYQAVYEYRSRNLPQESEGQNSRGRFERLSNQKFEAWERQREVSEQNKDDSKSETVSGRSTTLDPLGSGGSDFG